MRLTWLAATLRSVGITVIEEPGWQTRGAEFRMPIAGVIGHHTASAPGKNCPSTSTLINGRPDLHGPLAQVQLCRDASVHIIASGIANHAGVGLWPGIPVVSRAQGGVNGNTIGIEAENSGVGEPWPVTQMQCYTLIVAALLAHELLPASRYCSHFEWRRPIGYKLDPFGPWVGGGDWYDGKPWTPAQRLATSNTFRARVAAVLGSTGDDDMTPAQEAKLDEDIALSRQVLAKLQEYFGVDPVSGHALDIRAKIDATYIEVADEDHPESTTGGTLGARVKGLAVGTLPPKPKP